MDVYKKCSDFLLFFTTVLCFLFGIEGYNLDVRIPIIKQGTEGSFFGFSVTGHTTDRRTPSADDGFANSLMLVGAPKYNTSQPGLSKPAGGIFRCPISSKIDDCTYEEYDVGGNQDDEEDKSDQWLGVRVGSQGPGGKVGVCAHRYKTKTKTKQKVSEISGLGKCWKLNADLTPDDLGSSSEWTPCDGLESGKKHYGYCQAGTGLYMVPQSTDPEQWWLAGGPGVGDWRGGIFGTTSLSEQSPLLWNIRSYLINVENEEDAQENFDKLGVNLNSYLGFSVVSGRFSDVGIQFVAGAPRSENVGAVVIFEPRLGGEVQIKKQSVLHGKYMTESFGYSLCTADLNGDGYDDLIVGAPLFYDRNTGAGGRVYIYLNKEKSGDFSGVEPITLTGSLDSMFGISIINLGDLDIDGKQDIAIGSPYENNGEGAVYIYHGSEDGIKQPETQLITPSVLPGDLPISRPFNYTFGYSLSGGVDLDGNDYPELVIGAFQTDSIVALRARPIVSIIASLNSSKPSLDPDIYDCDTKINGKPTMCFDITVIMRQTTRSEFFIEETVDVIFSIEAETERRENLRKPSRVIFEKTGKYEVTDERMTLKAIVEEDDTESEPYKVIIQKGFTDIYRPIPFRLSFQLVETEPEMPSPGEPLPDMMDYPILEGAIDGKISKDDPSLSIDFEKECAKDDGVCKTDLSMTVTHNLPGDPPILTVGGQDELEIKILLKNLNEAAYDAKIEIAFPETLHFSIFAEMAIQKCSTSDTEPTLITCKLGNPYPTTLKAEMYVFKFDASDVPSDSDNFTITINATAANIDTNPTDNSVVIVAEVRGITDIQISAKAELDQYFYSGMVIGESAFEFEEDIGMLVKHTWKVFNNGPGIVEQSMVTFDFPFESSTGKWLLYMTEPPQIVGHTGSCEIDPLYINPVGYRKRFPVDYDEADIGSDYDELVTAGPTTADVKEETNEETGKGTGETDINQRRRRRDVDEGSFRRSKRKSGDGGKAKDLDCMGKGSDAPMCFQFTCTLDALYSRDEAHIVLRSRLWNSTFIEDFLDEDLVVLYSYGEVEILGTPFLTQNNTKNDRDRLPTNVKRDLDLVPPARVKWWIILLAVLGGLILLIIFILILWKCGFFRRKNREYKYAQVEQMSAAKGKMDKRIYYDDAYM